MREFVFLGLAGLLPRLQASDRLRSWCLRAAGAKIEGRVAVRSFFRLYPIGGAKKLKIGGGTVVNSEVRIAAGGGVEIGKKVFIGSRVSMETTSHSLSVDKTLDRSSYSKRITIEDGAWIGAGATLTPGVTIGTCAIVAAGAVVAKDVEPFTLVGGVPAKKIRDLDRPVD